MLKKAIGLVLLPAAAAVLVACGGGSGGTASAVVFTGVAAYGAPYPAGSKLTVKDALGNTVIDQQSITSADGSYTLNIPATAKAPFVISVTSEELPTLVSLVPEKVSGIANLTPITNLISAHLATSGNPADLSAELVGGRQISPTDVVAKTTEVQNVLSPLFAATGVTGNPLTQSFSANGTGMDYILDSLKLDVIPAAGSTNIVIGLKTSLADTEAPLEVTYKRASGSSAQPVSLSTVTDASTLQDRLAPSGLSLKISDWVGRMVSCHAENIDSRVNRKNLIDATAANIISETCKGLFLNSVPASYRSNGYAVNAREHFSGIFWASGTDLEISNPQIEYVVKNDNTTIATQPMNGDVVFSYRWRTKDNKTDISVVQGRLVNGKLYVTGNLSEWDVGVNPRIEKRVFSQSNMANRTYVNTGYSIYANATKHGQSVGYIKVTTPNNKILHLKKRDGYDYYVLVNSAAALAGTGLTSVLRLAGAYLDNAQNGSPRDMDNHLFWAKNPDTDTGDWTDAQLAAIPNQGNWKFEMYASAGGAFIGSAVRRTISRAPTIEEIKAVNWPQITPDGMNKIAATTNTTSGSVLIQTESNISLAGLGGENYWSVGANPTWLPTGGRVSGAYFPGGFCSPTDPLRTRWTEVLVNNVLTLTCVKENTTDEVRFRSDARKITVPCSTQGEGDKHCAASTTPNEPLKFKANNAYSFSTLWGFDSRRVENSLSLDTRKTPAPL